MSQETCQWKAALLVFESNKEFSSVNMMDGNVYNSHEDHGEPGPFGLSQIQQPVPNISQQSSYTLQQILLQSISGTG